MDILRVKNWLGCAEAAKPEERYDLRLENLTRNDLMLSFLPNDRFDIWVSLWDSKWREYRLVYSADSRSSADYFPRVSVEVNSDQVSEERFRRRVDWLKEFHEGQEIPGRPIVYSEHSSRRDALIHEGKIRFDQTNIGMFLRELESYFDFVNIERAYFDDVPGRLIRDPGFGPDKIVAKRKSERGKIPI